jgi:hypothetical protein
VRSEVLPNGWDLVISAARIVEVKTKVTARDFMRYWRML